MDYVYGPGRNHLFVPGPVNIPEPVLRAMNRNNEDYRSPAIPAMTKTLLEDVKKIFKSTSGTPFLIPTTGMLIYNEDGLDFLFQVTSSRDHFFMDAYFIKALDSILRCSDAANKMRVVLVFHFLCK